MTTKNHPKIEAGDWRAYLARAIPFATDRREDEPCQKGTDGCAVDHSRQLARDEATGELIEWTYDTCETW